VALENLLIQLAIARNDHPDFPPVHASPGRLRVAQMPDAYSGLALLVVDAIDALAATVVVGAFVAAVAFGPQLAFGVQLVVAANSLWSL
jgi:hypothetical protein